MNRESKNQMGERWDCDGRAVGSQSVLRLFNLIHLLLVNRFKKRQLVEYFFAMVNGFTNRR